MQYSGISCNFQLEKIYTWASGEGETRRLGPIWSKHGNASRLGELISNLGHTAQLKIPHEKLSDRKLNGPIFPTPKDLGLISLRVLIG